MRHDDLSWIEVDKNALTHNVATFRRLAGEQRRLMVVLKSNAYGHGMLEIAAATLEAGADWLAVFSFSEALELRRAEIDAPILVLGPAGVESFAVAAEMDIRLTVGSADMAQKLIEHGKQDLCVHLKLETGTNRQGLSSGHHELVRQLNDIPNIKLEGAYTHFADIEDTTDHAFAEGQLARFKESIKQLEALDVRPPLLHTACTAATMLFEETHFNMVRVGIGTYGLWPSKETFVSARQLGREVLDLKPVMCWKTRIAQLKSLQAGEYVGYGRTFRCTRPTRLAILPVGYANGYDRGLSNKAHVLIRGKRAPVCGRVMMNMLTVDVSDIEDVAGAEEVVLLGIQGEESISAEMMAGWLGTINYEVVTRAEPGSARRLV